MISTHRVCSVPSQQNYGYNYYGNEYYDDEQTTIQCYMCIYHSNGIYQEGHSNCDDPFETAGIPVIPCRGSCAVSRHSPSPYAQHNTIQAQASFCVVMHLSAVRRHNATTKQDRKRVMS